MKPTKFQVLFSFLLFGLIAAGIGQSVQAAIGLPYEVTVIGLMAFSLMRSVRKTISGRSFYPTSGIVQNDVQVEIWANFIAENIYKNNEFLAHAFDADDYVLEGKVVHIPQSGAASAVSKNRSSLPATVTKRTDTDITYPIDEFTTDPRLIPNADTVELSYDKMSSVMTDDMNALGETVAENMLINWAPSLAANIVRTTGGAVVAHTPSATGNRKLCTEADYRAMMKLANRHSMPQDGRYNLVDADMYDQLIASLSQTQYADFSKYYDAEKGIVGKLHTWNIMMRSTVLVYDNETTPVVKAYAAAGAATDNAASLFWHKDSVERAKGEIKVFNQDNSPTYYGDLMSFLMRMGGRIRRTDGKGVYALVQAASA